jgi:hypothetical protein
MKRIFVFAFTCSLANAAVITSGSGIALADFVNAAGGAPTPTHFTLAGDNLSITLDDRFAGIWALMPGHTANGNYSLSGNLDYTHTTISIGGNLYEGWTSGTFIDSPFFFHGESIPEVGPQPFTLYFSGHINNCDYLHEPCANPDSIYPFAFTLALQGTVTATYEPGEFYYIPIEARYTVEGGSLTITESPEPASVVMMGLGITLLGSAKFAFSVLRRAR